MAFASNLRGQLAIVAQQHSEQPGLGDKVGKQRG